MQAPHPGCQLPRARTPDTQLLLRVGVPGKGGIALRTGVVPVQVPNVLRHQIDEGTGARVKPEAAAYLGLRLSLPWGDHRGDGCDRGVGPCVARAELGAEC